MAAGLLLDTCVAVWSALAPREISRAARRALTDPDAFVCLGSISVAEIARLAQKGRIELRDHWKPWLRRVVEENGWTVLPATWEVMEEAYSLPDEFHGDPADRLLVATARLQGLTLVTPDRRIRRYPHVRVIW